MGLECWLSTQTAGIVRCLGMVPAGREGVFQLNGELLDLKSKETVAGVLWRSCSAMILEACYCGVSSKELPLIESTSGRGGEEVEAR